MMTIGVPGEFAQVFLDFIQSTAGQDIIVDDNSTNID